MQPRLRTDLALETLNAQRLAQRGVQDLQRHAPPVAHVLGEVDRRGRAAAERFLEEVAVSQGVGQVVARSGHAGKSVRVVRIYSSCAAGRGDAACRGSPTRASEAGAWTPSLR